MSFLDTYSSALSAFWDQFGLPLILCWLLVAATTFAAVYSGSKKVQLQPDWCWALGVALLPLPVLAFWIVAFVERATQLRVSDFLCVDHRLTRTSRTAPGKPPSSD